VRCAPPANKPTIDERDACLPYLAEELTILRHVRVVVCLGRFAWDGLLRLLRDQWAQRKLVFGHAVEAAVGPYHLLGCFHPSQQNTFTGRLTQAMLDAVMHRARELALAGERGGS